MEVFGIIDVRCLISMSNQLWDILKHEQIGLLVF